jgi:hypothetical protein
MPDDPLPRLTRWFAAHCDGEWEHGHGISITTTDNPGWWVKVALGQTELADRDFVPVLENIDTNGHPCALRWLHCSIKDGQWQGAGDETRLDEILAIFLAWADG